MKEEFIKICRSPMVENIMSKMSFCFEISTIKRISPYQKEISEVTVMHFIKEDGSVYYTDYKGRYSTRLIQKTNVKKPDIKLLNLNLCAELLSLNLGAMSQVLGKIHDMQEKLLEYETLIQRDDIAKQQTELKKEYNIKMFAKTRDLIKKINSGDVDLEIIKTDHKFFKSKVYNVSAEAATRSVKAERLLLVNVVDVVRKYAQIYFKKNIHLLGTDCQAIRQQIINLEKAKSLITKDSKSVIDVVSNDKDFQTLLEWAENLEKLIGFVGREIHPCLSLRVGQKDRSSQTDFKLLDVSESDAPKKI